MSSSSATAMTRTKMPNSMDGQKPNFIEDLGGDLKQYVNLRMDELKYKSARSASSAIAQVLSYLLIIVVLAIVLGLLAYALLQWLNAAIGAPWGTLIVAGVFLILLIVLWCLRGKMFYATFSNVFVGEDPDSVDRNIASLTSRINTQEKKLGRRYQSAKKRLRPVSLIASGFQSSSGKVLASSAASWILSAIIKGIKRKKK